MENIWDEERPNKSAVEARQEQAIRLVETGVFLQEVRKKRGLTVVDAAKMLEISRSYLSEIEHGRKMPSDILIEKLEDFYGLPETELFALLGKVPLKAREEILRSKTLQRTLHQIGKDKRLSEDDRERIYNDIERMYRELLQE